MTSQTTGETILTSFRQFYQDIEAPLDWTYYEDAGRKSSKETTVKNKDKLILTEIFPSVQKHDI